MGKYNDKEIKIQSEQKMSFAYSHTVEYSSAKPLDGFCCGELIVRVSYISYTLISLAFWHPHHFAGTHLAIYRLKVVSGGKD
jgi:hypothetical protein